MRHNNSGISLVEFAVALITVAVSVLYAAPLYYRMANAQRATAYTNELVATLTFARTQAVMKAQPVSVCASDNGLRCSNTAWEHGYIVFVDEGAPGKVDATDSILRRHLTGKPQATITLNGDAYIRFNSAGAVTAHASNVGTVLVASTQSWIEKLSPIATAEAASDVLSVRQASYGTFTVCAGHTGRVVKLSPQGLISTSTTQCQ